MTQTLVQKIGETESLFRNLHGLLEQAKNIFRLENEISRKQQEITSLQGME